uniref:F-box and regulator of chromosome condensation repeat protein n=1 Tax=Marseillevirus LCMAC201 TaxID=2506605 RepID=A0A481YY08_9VIRU|nr:MAG: F-box and regulator of chromosome condensation repeat protein [Marseillevirus LCMAC201]
MTNVLLAVKDLRKSFTYQDITVLANYYSLSPNILNSDKYWLVAIHNLNKFMPQMNKQFMPQMNLEDLPYEDLFNIALELPLEDLKSLCLTNKAMAKICTTNSFWRMRYEKNHPMRIFPTISTNVWEITGILDDGTAFFSTVISGDYSKIIKPPDDHKFIQVVTTGNPSGTDVLCLLDNGNILKWDGKNQVILSQEGHKFIQVSAGDFHTLGLVDDGTVVGWGNNKYGQAPPIKKPPEGHKFIQVSAGGFHTLGLVDDGTVIGWGRNKYGQAPPIKKSPEGHKFIQVSAGNDHSLGLLDGGSVICWGSNYFGECRALNSLLTYENTYPNITKLISSNKTYSKESDNILECRFTQIAAGHNSSMGLLNDGRIFEWGRDVDSNPVSHVDGHKFIQIAHEHFSCGLLDDGTLLRWGAGKKDLVIIPPPGRSFKV